jgi:hypothetical protein
MRISLFAVAIAMIAGPAAGQSPTAAPACASAGHRALDFWVGRWDVSPTGTDKIIAHSLIERLYDGCAIRENWMPIGRSGGGSLSSYDPDARAWLQTWVDSSGATVQFKGGMQGEAMVMTAPWKDVLGPGKSALIRMTYSREAAGAVRQKGESSVDAGKSWQPSFDFTYRPAAVAVTASETGGAAKAR